MRGRRTIRPLLESEIRAAQAISPTGKACAITLGVGFITYMKYAKMYGLYEKRLAKKGCAGILRPKDPYKSNQKLNDILDNKYPDAWRPSVLKKLIKANLKKNECETCGYNEKRVTDDEVPLVLCFKDENYKNFALENLQVCCFNCSHNLHDMAIVKKPLHMHKSHGRKQTIQLPE